MAEEMTRSKKRQIANTIRSHTKIIATVGPATESPAMIRQLIKAGVNIFRLNFSHGEPEHHAEVAKTIRKAADDAGVNIAILQDLPGPKIRIGKLPDGKVELKEGKQVILTTSAKAQAGKIPVNYKNLNKDLKPGRTIFLDDGELQLKALKISGDDIICEVLTGGILKEKKGLNLPGTSLTVKTPTATDLKLLEFGLGIDVDLVALSFVRTADDIIRAKRFLQKQGKHKFIISKIEKFEALDNIDEIIEQSDGIMVARGDLGVEIPIENVPGAQRMIISKCNQAGKPVITATQMLDSMIERPSPTRAEATDVANAVINGADAVMLSGETAVGKYPIKAVEYLMKIAMEAEKFAHWKKYERSGRSITDTISRAAASAAEELEVAVILTPTRSGRTGFFVSRFRPRCPIIAFTSSHATYKELTLAWGVEAYLINQDLPFQDMVRQMKAAVVNHGIACPGNYAIITAGSPDSQAGQTNLMMVEKIK